MQMLPRAVSSVFYLAALSCSAVKGEMQTVIEIGQGRALVRGVVRENVRNCEVDGPCYLVLSTDSTAIRLYYHHGEYPPCANESSAQTGFSIGAGDHVEASGLYSSANQVHMVDVCCADCFLMATPHR
jgi:hypothetical protein